MGPSHSEGPNRAPSLRLNPSRIYLNGFMGSGKSTVGPLLARRMGWTFADLDDRIVNEIGMPIANYFTRFGETRFREVEAEQLLGTAQDRRHVIAVGGGALCQPDNLDWVLDQGTVVYLRVDVDELVRRLKAEKVSRPMLHGEDGQVLGDDVLITRITNLLASREPLYARAHVTIDVTGKSVGTIADEIVGMLG